MKVLVIDDDEQIRRLLSLVLSNVGWEVEEASDGASGLRLAVDGRPDVILLDINLPDMGGSAVLASIRAWSALPVIVVSVRDSEADISGFLNGGADDYIITRPSLSTHSGAENSSLISSNDGRRWMVWKRSSRRRNSPFWRSSSDMPVR